MDIVTCVVLALAVAAASFTIARTKVTAPFRAAILKRSKWFGALVSCPYCVSHWLAAGAVAIYRPTPVETWTPVDLAVAWMFVVATGAAVIGVIGRAIAPAPPSSPPAGEPREQTLAEYRRVMREPIGGGQSIPPQHRDEYNRMVEERRRRLRDGFPMA